MENTLSPKPPAPSEDRLSRMYRLQHELNCRIGMDTLYDPNRLKWLFAFAYQIGDEANELQKCCLTKWWVEEYRRGGRVFETVLDEENARVEAIDILHFLLSVFQLLGMTPKDILEVYERKHQVNVLRQENGYDISHKTEDDNQAIGRIQKETP